MKNLKTMVLGFVILSTAFVAWGYFCEKCRTIHQWPGECIVFDSSKNNARIMNYITNLIKDELRRCPSLDRADEVILKFRYIFEVKELEYRYYHLWTTAWDQNLLQEIREFLDDLDRRIMDYGHSNNGSVIDWEEILDDSSEFVSTSSNNGNS